MVANWSRKPGRATSLKVRSLNLSVDIVLRYDSKLSHLRLSASGLSHLPVTEKSEGSNPSSRV